MIATIVRVPHRILIGAGHLPGYLIPARGLLRANRHPVAAKLVKLTVYNRRPTIAQFDRRPAIRIKKIVAPTLNQAGRSECLDRGEHIAAHLESSRSLLFDVSSRAASFHCNPSISSIVRNTGSSVCSAAREHVAAWSSQT